MGCHASSGKSEIGLSNTVFEVEFIAEKSKMTKHNKTKTMLLSMEDVTSISPGDSAKPVPGRAGRKHARTRTGGLMSSMRKASMARRPRTKSWHHKPLGLGLSSASARSKKRDSSLSSKSRRGASRSRSRPRHTRKKSHSRAANRSKVMSEVRAGQKGREKSQTIQKGHIRRKKSNGGRIGQHGHSRNRSHTWKKSQKQKSQKQRSHARHRSLSTRPDHVEASPMRQSSHDARAAPPSGVSSSDTKQKTSHSRQPGHVRPRTHVRKANHYRSPSSRGSSGGEQRHRRQKSSSGAQGHRRTKSGRRRQGSKSHLVAQPSGPVPKNTNVRHQSNQSRIGGIVALRSVQQNRLPLRNTHEQ